MEPIMRHPVWLIPLVIFCIVSALPATASEDNAMPTTAATTTIRQETYKGLPAYRISNGTIELIAVPQTGRIARFAFVGGKNVLWENPLPKAEAKDGYNDGGDKVWVWPQADWPKRIGRGWPGPDATDLPYGVEKMVDQGSGGQPTLRLTSRVFTGYGVRAVRDITLQGNAAHIVTRFEKVEAGNEFPAAVWTVAELPFPDALAVRLIADSPLPGSYKQDTTWGPVTAWKLLPAGDATPAVRLVQRPTTSGKVFVDADSLGAAKGDVALIQRVRASKDDRYNAGDRAQLYTEATPAPADAATASPFIELEFTSPLVALAQGQSLSLDMTWELHHINPQQAKADLARLLAGR
jgi:hypothetical protein